MPDIVTECKRALEDAGLQPELCDGTEFHHIAPHPYLMLKYPVVNLFGYIFIFPRKNYFIVARFDCIKSFNGEPETFHRGISVYDNVRDVVCVVQRIYDRFSTLDDNISKRIGHEILEFYSKYTDVVPNYIEWDNPTENASPIKFGIIAVIGIFIVQFEQVKVIMPMCDINNPSCYRCEVVENKLWASKLPTNLSDKIIDVTPREGYKFPNGEIPDLGEEDKYNIYMMEGPHGDESPDSDAGETKAAISNEDINTLINALTELKMSNQETRHEASDEQKGNVEQKSETEEGEEHKFDEDARQEENQPSQSEEAEEAKEADEAEHEENEEDESDSDDTTPITTHGKTYEIESYYLEKLAHGLDLAFQMHRNKYDNSMILIGTRAAEQE